MSAAALSPRLVSGRTFEGAPGHARDARSELFLLAVSNMVGEDTFYEGKTERDQRFRDLVHRLAVQDGEWLARFLKRGVADAVVRLYSERSLLKYDTDSRGWRFGDVIDLVHPTPDPALPWQGELFKHALDRRHRRDEQTPHALGVLAARAELMALPVDRRRAVLADPERLRAAGMTWESLAGWLQGPMDAAAWEAVLGSMGYMARLRNLRNFDEAGISDKVAAHIAAGLADPAQVARSRQFPFRFLAAHRAASSLRWAYPLEQALAHSLAGVPALGGRTLVLIDRSPSMWTQKLSAHSTMPWADAAAVFGTAIALRAEHADLVQFGIRNTRVKFRGGESLLKILDRFGRLDGTDIPSAVKRHFRGHDRVVIVTDEQTRPGWLPSNGAGCGGGPEMRINDLIPRDVPLYIWNFGGYEHGASPSGEENRHTFGGLTDAAFRMIPLLEAGRDVEWPF